MLDLGRFPYINDGINEDGVLVLDGVPSDADKVKVMYNNTGNKDVLVEKGSVTVRLVDVDSGVVIRTAKADEEFFLAANLKTKLGEIDLKEASEETALAAGKTYEVRAYLNGEQLDETLKVYVKSDDKSIDSVKVKVDGRSYAAVADGDNYKVVLPYGVTEAKAKAVTEDDITIVLEHGKAKVVDLEKDSSDELVWKFKVKSENGVEGSEVTITLVITSVDTVEIRQGTDANQLVVKVTDSEGNVVKGIPQAKFEVKDNDEDVAITKFATNSAGEYVLTLDVEDGTDVTGLTVTIDGKSSN